MQTEQVLIDIRERLVRVETKIDAQSEAQNDVKILVNKVKETADEALDKAESAQQRIEKIDKIIFWVSTTIIGAIILGLITMYVQSGGGVT